MIRIDENYTPYYDGDDPAYPGGKAIPVSAGNRTDGTPWRALWFNTILGFLQALVVEAKGSFIVSGTPDKVGESDLLDALKAVIAKTIPDADLGSIPTTLQTTDPPTYVVARLDITNGGAGYAVGDEVIIRTPDVLGAPEVHATVSAINDEGGITTGAITALDFDVTTVYAQDPSGAGKAVTGGSGTGAVVSVRTAYAPGDIQIDGELRFVPIADPLVQSSRMRGFLVEYLLDSEVSLNVRRLEAMRKWSPDYIYSESEVTFMGAWFVPNPDDMPVFGQSPVSDPQKWVKVGGLDDQAAVEIAKLKAMVELLKAEIFGGTVTFNNHFVLDFYTMDGVNLAEGVWNEEQGRIEV
jgi:hypothetical protein